MLQLKECLAVTGLNKCPVKPSCFLNALASSLVYLSPVSMDVLSLENVNKSLKTSRNVNS